MYTTHYLPDLGDQPVGDLLFICRVLNTGSDIVLLNLFLQVMLESACITNKRACTSCGRETARYPAVSATPARGIQFHHIRAKVVWLRRIALKMKAEHKSASRKTRRCYGESRPAHWMAHNAVRTLVWDFGLLRLLLYYRSR